MFSLDRMHREKGTTLVVAPMRARSLDLSEATLQALPLGRWVLNPASSLPSYPDF